LASEGSITMVVSARDSSGLFPFFSWFVVIGYLP
jgi:hypothetical protein